MSSPFALVRVLTWRGKVLFAGSVVLTSIELCGAYLLADLWATGMMAGRLALGVGVAVVAKRGVDVLLERDASFGLHRAFFSARLQRGRGGIVGLQEAAVVDALFAAERTLVFHLPALVGAAFAALAALAHLAQSPDRFVRLLSLGAGGIAALLATLSLRGWARKQQERAVVAYREGLAPAVSAAVRAAPEIIASGQGDSAMGRYAGAAEAWGGRVLKASFASMGARRGIWFVGALSMWGTLYGLARADVQTIVPVGAAGLVIASGFAAALSVSAYRVKWQELAALFAVARSAESVHHAEDLCLKGTLELRGLEFQYADNPLWATPLSVRTENGQMLAIAGPNGSGKSTCLALLAGLRLPLRGTVLVGEKPPHLLGTFDFGYLPQLPHFGENQTVRDAMRFPDDALEVLEPWLKKVHLLDALSARSSDIGSIPVMTLSSGQRQRLAWARILARRSTVMLLDEPEANLDAAGLDLVAELLGELRGKVTIVLSTHDPRLLALADVRIDLPSGTVTWNRQ